MGLWGNSNQQQSTPAPTPPTFQPAPQSPEQLQQQRLAIKEALYTIETQQDIVYSLTNTCYNKCVGLNKFNDTELSVGEAACNDRCVAKYLRGMQQLAPLIQTYLAQQMQGAQGSQIPQQ